MGAAIDGLPDLPGMVPRISGRSIDSDLATIPIRVRAEEPSPMSELPDGPAQFLRFRYRRLNLLVGMP